MTYTAELVNYIHSSQLDDIPQDVRREAKRALVNIVGCALGGAEHPAMDMTIEALGPYAGAATAGVLGR